MPFFLHGINVSGKNPIRMPALVAKINPLWPKSGGQETLFHGTFLLQPVSQAAFKALKPPAAEGERAVLVDNAILLHCPHGYGKTKLNNSFFERAHGARAASGLHGTVIHMKDMPHVN